MIPPVVMRVLVTLAMLTGMTLESVTPWEPDPAEATALAKTLYGECRGCSELQQRAVCWTVFNRVDDPRFPDNIIDVLEAPYQFAGYQTSFPVWDNLYDLACECMTDWHNGENRVLESEFVFFHGNGRINIFTTQYGRDEGKRWAEE